MRKILLVAMLVAAAGAACRRGPQAETESAVRQAIERYLASRPNLNPAGMNLEVRGIQFRGATAQASVTLRAKTDAQASMSLQYTLRRKGEGWEVEAQPAAAAPGGSSDLPAGHPAVGSSAAPRAETSELPPGHPPVQKK